MALPLEEAQEQCFVRARSLVAFIHEGGLGARSVAPLTKIIEDASELDDKENLQKCEKIQECIQLCQELGFSMAYLDHQALLDILVQNWEAICALLFSLKKQAGRKLKLIESDAKAEDEVKQKYEDIKNNLEKECAIANITLTKAKLMAKAEDF